MKFRKLLISTIALLGLASISGITANADSTSAEANASTAVDNQLIKEYGNHVPESASLKAEAKLNEEFGGPSPATKSIWNATVGKQKHTTFDNYYQSKDSANSNKVNNNNGASNSTSENNSIKQNKSQNKAQNKPQKKLHKRTNKPRKKITKKTHKDKVLHKTNYSKSLKNKPTNNYTHHYIGIGIIAIIVIAIIGFAVKLFSRKGRHSI